MSSPFVVLSIMLSVALQVPMVIGLKVTFMVQVELMAKEAGQLLF